MKYQSEALFVAQAVNENMKKEASGLGGTLASVIARGRGVLTGAAEKVAPAMNSGFSAIGRGTAGMRPGAIRDLLLGSDVNMGAGNMVGPNTFSDLGKTVAKRVGTGAGVGVGGLLAGEAPFKADNNARFEQQQQHPLRAWLAQHLAGAPKLHRESYLSPI